MTSTPRDTFSHLPSSRYLSPWIPVRGNTSCLMVMRTSIMAANMSSWRRMQVKQDVGKMYIFVDSEMRSVAAAVRQSHAGTPCGTPPRGEERVGLWGGERASCDFTEKPAKINDVTRAVMLLPWGSGRPVQLTCADRFIYALRSADISNSVMRNQYSNWTAWGFNSLWQIFDDFVDCAECVIFSLWLESTPRVHTSSMKCMDAGQ